MPVVIGFLANQVGLNKIGAKLREIIGSIREKVDGGINWLIDMGMGALNAVMNALGLGGKPEGKDAATAKPGDVDKPLKFGDESHTMRGHVVNGQLSILMASDGFDKYDAKISDLRYVVVGNLRRSKDPADQAKGDELDKRLTGLETKIDLAISKYLASKDPVARDHDMRVDLDDITGTLTRIADDFGLHHLRFEKVTHNVAYSMGTYNRARVADGYPISIDSKSHGSPSASIPVAGYQLVGSLGYQRGHLVANILGGPGDNIQNLTPISAGSNTRMRDRPEKSAAAAISSDPSTVLRYTTTCNYPDDATAISDLDSWLATNLGAAPGSAKGLFGLAEINAISPSNVRNALGIANLSDQDYGRVLGRTARHFLAESVDVRIEVKQGSATVLPSDHIPNHLGISLP
jgi:hypothetical protein